MVSIFIASLKVAVMLLLRATDVAKSAGAVGLTVGAIMSAAVKDHTLAAARAFPARSLAPTVTVAVYTVLEISEASGLKVATESA